MIWVLGILQIISIKIGWWVYKVYFTQPPHNHPPIFWSYPMTILLVYGPSAGIVGLIIAAFFLTAHPWTFLVFTLLFWSYYGHKARSTTQSSIMPTLAENGVEFEPLSTEELLADIRAHKWKSPPNKEP